MKYAKAFNRKLRGMRITQLMARDGTACSICSETLDRHVRDPDADAYITFDHIVAASVGGTDVITNLRLAHRKCNQLRGNAPLQEPAA